MNYRAVAWLLGCVLLLFGAFLLVPAGVAAIFGAPIEPGAFPNSPLPFLGSALTAGLVGGLLILLNRGSIRRASGGVDFYRREGLAVVGVSWLLCAAVGALPFLFSGFLDSPVDAFFESASGFTTTGSTILGAQPGAGIEDLPRGLAFWRSFTHWLGGIGIVLVFVVLFPAGGRSLFRSEVPGVSREAVQQRVRDSAATLLKIYVGLTALEIALLVLTLWRLPVFTEASSLEVVYDACVHSFGTLATGGFSTHANSIAFYGSFRVELILIVFMFAAGVNFGVYDVFLRLGPRSGWKTLVRSPEVLAYAAMVVGFTLVLGFFLWFWGGNNGLPGPGQPVEDYRSIAKSMRDALFNVVSLQTSTGYGTADFDQWPQFCRALLMFMAFIGACAGSTGGGFKIIRFIIVVRAALRGLQRFSRPRAIHTVRLGGEPLDDNTVGLVMGYAGLWFLVFAAGTLVVTSFGVELETASTSVLATLNNIGPGLAMVGPTQNFGWMPDVPKVVLSLLMIVGRLEFYAVAVLLAPRFWRH